MIATRERFLAALLLMNFALQVFDGLATYFAVRAGFAEGNPIVAWAITQVGAAPALFLFKVEAILCVCLLWHLRARSGFAAPALAATAAIYVTYSFLPWSTLLATLHGVT